MNEFVSYLNSTNNVGGNSTGSLAESQVKSKFYDSVKVDRKLGSYITDCVRSGDHKAFILTGHAGDGKTSILVQVLKALGYLQNGVGLQAEEEHSDFLYIKDMSEISASKQTYALQKALLAPSSHKTSLLISNTGPLLKTFEALIKGQKESRGEIFTSKDKLELQSALLTQLDSNKDEALVIGGYSFILVNIARVDNVPFATKILKNILNDSLWAPCQNCVNASHCPIKNNHDIVVNQFDRVAAFIENYYRYLYENDKRMTIRQMVGQISYALTGNLTCSDISSSLKEPYFNYNFANLFFGYVGLKSAKDTAQIKGIRQIQNLELDKISLDVDYKLFVSQDYSCFTPSIEKELQALSSKHQRHYRISSADQVVDEKKSEKELQHRQAIRRFYLIFSLAESKAEIDHVLNQVFGTLYTDYCQLISSKQSKHKLNEMRAKIFDALYMKNTGFLPNGKTELPLTLRREDEVFQNVMIVLGEVNRSDLSVIQLKATSKFEDVENKHEVVLRMEDKDFKLTLPMINYFNDLIDGAIASNNNPALSHGIAQLDALLLAQFGEEKPECEEDCELTVIINTTRGQEIERFSFDGNRLSIS